MNLLNIPLTELSETTFKILIESDPGINKESLTLDFKADIQLDAEKQKQKLLKWVSSFANTAGGDLLIGVTQKEISYEITGIPDGINADNLQQQISSIINLNLEPRLSRPVEFREILVDGAKILVVRTHQSFNKPHAVKVNDGYKFFIRLPNGQSMPMDIQQVRSAVIGSETLTQQIKAFKADRIASLLSGNAPFPLRSEGKIIIHTVPLEAFSQKSYFNPQLVEKFKCSCMIPLRSDSFNFRYNLEGFAVHDIGQSKNIKSYIQFFRSGSLEFIDCIGPAKTIPSQYYEQFIAESVNKALDIYKGIQINPPYFISVTLMDVKGYAFGLGNRYIGNEPIPLDKEVICLPDITINTSEVNLFEELKCAFDMVWQCFGYERSYNYDEHGEWVKRHY